MLMEAGAHVEAPDDEGWRPLQVAAHDGHAEVMAQPAGNAKMQEIALAIQEGSNAFLTREYSWLAVFVGVTATLFAVTLNMLTSLCFVLGAFISGSTGWLGAPPPRKLALPLMSMSPWVS
jgi:Na+/H+-translocating membrane pyrophosphatase